MRYAIIHIRPAIAADLAGLLALENACFHSDRLTRRQFHYMLTRAQAVMLVAVDNQRATAPPVGYVVVLFRRMSSSARLYSIAVAEQSRGQGVAQALVEAAEQAAWARDCRQLRLEIRRDNLPSQRLFARLGYEHFGVVANYYADHMDALRYQKTRLSVFRDPKDRMVNG